MNQQTTRRTLSHEQSAVIRWTAAIGAITAEALAETHQISAASARARLGVAARQRLLRRNRPLTEVPTLYSVTAAGLAAAGLDGFAACRISAANCQHTAACVHAAAELQRRYPDRRVSGERELRLEERRAQRPVASAIVRGGMHGATLHRPDLVLWPREHDCERPVAVEIELTIKSPRRLEAICRAWSRSRVVAGVVYFAPPDVERALTRAIHSARAEHQIAVLALETLPLAAAVHGSS
ncbi:MAG TPA: hypothetical protein VH025_04385 [Solirubrobacteraceae bacterium]|nr:hypothetical protein [Solirubrobacteraceae bacterium]